MKLRVAAVQLNDLQLAADESQAQLFSRAAALADKAARQGAQLICFPEIAFSGFVFSERMWEKAESWEASATLDFLRRCAKQHSAYVGAGMLVAEGDDFRNVWVLVGPDERIVGKVYKSVPASMESNFFTGGDCGRCIEIPRVGRVAVAICYENLLAPVSRSIGEAWPDLLVAPFSAPRMDSPFPLSASADAWFCAFMEGAAAESARAYGVPCLAVNKSGPWVSPVVGVPLEARTVFGGRSAIADRDGRTLAALPEAPRTSAPARPARPAPRTLAGAQAIVAEVELGPRPGGPLGPPRRTRGRWAVALPWQMRTFPSTSSSAPAPTAPTRAAPPPPAPPRACPRPGRPAPALAGPAIALVAGGAVLAALAAAFYGYRRARAYL
eukprot:tig00000711_g3417.t1